MMRKCLWHKQLRLRYGLSVARPAFTLAELVVSIGILVLMMSLAGQVFNLTVKSTGQATALTEVMQQLRAFEQTLRDDLRGVQPGNSLILIQGNPVNAYWTQSGKDADDDGNPSDDKGYPHAADPEREKADGSGNAVQPRADILMIFTARPGVSYVEAGTSPLTSNLQQVVYGHAELGEYVTSEVAGQKYKFEPAPQAFPTDTLAGAEYPSDKKVSPVPAAQWHLARRSVLLLPNNPPVSLTPPLTSLDDPRLLECQTDVFQPEAVGAVRNFRYEDDVLRPQLSPTTGLPMGDPWFLPAIFGDVTKPYPQWKNPFARSKLDPAPPALYANRIGDYLLPNCASFEVEWTLNPRSEFVAGRLDGVNEVFWFDPGDNGDPANTVPKPDPLRSLGDRVAALKPGGSTACATNDTACKNLLKNLDSLLSQGSYLDALPPYSLSDRFRVRNPAEGDSNAWDRLPPNNPRPNLVVFTATRPAPPPAGAPAGTPPSEPVLDPMFPGALRITIDVFDKERRLDRPIRHVMVIPIGG